MSRESQVVGILVGGVAALASLLLSSTGLLQRVENATVDLRFQLERAMETDATADSSIVIVDFDRRTLDEIPALRERFGRWPWPRSVHATLLRFVDLGDPAAIAFDLRFEDAKDGAADSTFAAEVARAKAPVVLATLFSGDDADPAAQVLEDARRRERIDALEAHALSARPSLEIAPRYYVAHPPLPGLLWASDGVGASNVVSDRDAVYRDVPVLATWHGLAYPSLGLAAALGGEARQRLRGEGDVLWLDDERLPLHDGRLWLHWRDRYGREPYPIVPAHELLESAWAMAAGHALDPAEDVTPSIFAGRTVLVGASGQDAGDLLLASPFDSTEPGLHLQATLLDTVLHRDFLRPLPAAWLLIVVLPLLAGMLFASLRATLVRMAAAGLVLAALVAAAALGFTHGGLVVPFVAPALGLSLAFVASLLPATVVEEAAALQGWIYRRLPASWRPEGLAGAPDPPRVFLSYRRHDTLAITGRIHDKMVERFGAEKIFMDFDAIPYGADFRSHLQRELERCEVFLVVMGTQWTGPTDEGPNRLLADPDDFVRLEVEVTLEKGIPIIPVLVDGATMPTEAEVPPSMRPLLYRQAAVVDVGLDFHVHMERLMGAVRSLRGTRAPATTQEPQPKAMRAAGS